MKTLLIGEIHLDAEKLLQEGTDLQHMSNEQFCAVADFPEVEALVLRTFTHCKKNELDFFPQLKYIVICSVGVNNLDLEEMEKRGITLIHVPGTNANSVAEHTLYLLFSLLREDVKKPFAELEGKTIGIIGLGHIGKLVARKMKGFGCKVIAFDVIEQDEGVLRELQVEMKSFEEVLGSDVVTVHVPLNKHTKHLINEDAFSKMREGAFFINTSREEVIDEDALVKLQSKFRGIGLDVYSEKLKQLEGNVVLTDHVAAQGEESFRQQCVKPVEKFLESMQR